MSLHLLEHISLVLVEPSLILELPLCLGQYVLGKIVIFVLAMIDLVAICSILGTLARNKACLSVILPLFAIVLAIFTIELSLFRSWPDLRFLCKEGIHRVFVQVVKRIVLNS